MDVISRLYERYRLEHPLSFLSGARKRSGAASSQQPKLTLTAASLSPPSQPTPTRILPIDSSDLRAFEMEIDDLILRRVTTDTGDALRQALGIGIEERFLAIDRSTLALAGAGVIAAGNSLVGNDTVVPECHTAGLPLPPRCQVVGRMQMFAQEIQRVDRFLALELRDVHHV